MIEEFIIICRSLQAGFYHKGIEAVKGKSGENGM